MALNSYQALETTEIKMEVTQIDLFYFDWDVMSLAGDPPICSPPAIWLRISILHAIVAHGHNDAGGRRL
jgi:hypothetical protein